MERSLYLALLILLVYTFSCTSFPDLSWQSEPTYSQKPQVAQVPVSDEPGPRTPPVQNGDSEEDSLSNSPALLETGSFPLESEEEIAELPKEPLEAGVDEPYTDQKRIDDALEIYQVALDYWHKGQPDKTIQALDQSYLIICSIQNENDLEIAQQKEDLRLLISKRILEVYTSRTYPQVGHNGGIPLVMNGHVAREIKSFQAQERKFFTQSYRRSGRYRLLIVQAMKKSGLPEDLSWLPLIESGFKTKAFSRARALGLWQFIASTGYRFDLRRDRWVDERMDPKRSTVAAIAYLKALHDLFGDWTTALAAYNCGEGNVLRVIRGQRVNYLDDFWDLYARLPMETARYVPRFLAALHIIKDPEQYGFSELQLDPPLSYETVKIKRPMRLKDIAKALGVPAKTLEELNPSLRHKATPNYAFELNVPVHTKAILLAHLENIPLWKPPRPVYVYHRVRYGETLSGIAMKYRVSIRRIVRANNLRSASRIRAGQRLKIPLRHQAIAASGKSSLPGGLSVRYQVKRGDSLWLIAKRFDTTVAKIKALNGMQSDLLHSGQILKIQKGSR
jgi:membrane-bound lytic murein transglycosylase D